MSYLSGRSLVLRWPGKNPGEHRNLWSDPAMLQPRAEFLQKLTDRLAFTADPLPHRTAPW